MAAATDDFAEQLRRIGLEPERLPSEFLVFDYEVEVGRHIGETVRLAVQVPGDWPMSPPSGPFVSPRLLPISGGVTGRGRPWDAVHTVDGRGLEDPGGVWEYWSRPFTAWPKTDRSVRAYLRHLRTLFAEIPPEAVDGEQAEAA
jgi:hypothetical protein